MSLTLDGRASPAERGPTWHFPGQDLAPLIDGVHVWRASLVLVPRTMELLATTLSPDEQERAQGFMIERARRQFTAARGILRQILGQYANIHPLDLRFRVGPLGKPDLEDASLRFSVSHSADLALYAVSATREVGVDVERIRPLTHLEGIVERFFSKQEQVELSALPAHGRERAFFRAWTRKEAVLKAKGEGLAGLERAATNDDAYSVVSLPVAAGYAAALAVERTGKPSRIECLQWPGLPLDVR